MTDEIKKNNSPESFSNIPQAKIKTKSHSLSPVWVIPIVAALIGGWLVFKSAAQENLIVEVSFESASGLEANKTPVKLRNVKVGELTEVKFSKDLSEVIVVMELSGITEKRLTDTTKFWVVRPRVGVEGVSGLDTLLSGAYVEMDPGEGGVSVKKFKGLEEPEIYQLGNPGTKYILKSHKLGSLNRGSPVKYRGITVGSVTKYKLVDDHSYVEIEVFVNAPHDKYVNAYSRFWNVSGMSVELGAKGLDFNMESVSSLIAGGVAFTNDYATANEEPAKENTQYTLHKTEKPEIEEVVTFGAPMKLYFENGVSGLSEGAPVEYKGIQMGTVTRVGVEENKLKNNIVTYAIVDIEPERLPSTNLNTHLNKKQRIKMVNKYFEKMISQGVRGQLKSNILTGQALVMFDMFEDAEKAAVKYVNGVMIVPTMPETVDGIMKQINDFLAKLKTIPLESIGNNLDEATNNINSLIKSLNVEEGGATGVQMNATMDELSRAAKSIRVMAEYLERHPESLIKGKSAE